MNYLNDFISSCVFVHDDTDASQGVDWDQHGTNPFLLGANICVVSSLEGFGDIYLNYLYDLGALANSIIVPKDDGKSLVENLLADQQTFHRLKRMIDIDKLDVSFFYTDKCHAKLGIALFGDRDQSRIHPSKDAFLQANDKVQMRRTLKDTGIPIPEGIICDSTEDLLYFYNQIENRFPRILVKKYHWDTLSFSSRDDIFKSMGTLKFPVIAEVAYPIKCSPVSHNLAWKDKVSHLFIVMQKVKGMKHAGNTVPTNIPTHLCDRIKDYSAQIIAQVRGFSGVFGVDFVITLDDQVIAVDINPRFNSSTYPFYFLQKMDFVWTISSPVMDSSLLG